MVSGDDKGHTQGRVRPALTLAGRWQPQRLHLIHLGAGANLIEIPLLDQLSVLKDSDKVVLVSAGTGRGGREGDAPPATAGAFGPARQQNDRARALLGSPSLLVFVTQRPSCFSRVSLPRLEFLPGRGKGSA